LELTTAGASKPRPTGLRIRCPGRCLPTPKHATHHRQSPACNDLFGWCDVSLPRLVIAGESAAAEHPPPPGWPPRSLHSATHGRALTGLSSSQGGREQTPMRGGEAPRLRAPAGHRLPTAPPGLRVGPLPLSSERSSLDGSGARGDLRGPPSRGRRRPQIRRRPHSHLPPRSHLAGARYVSERDGHANRVGTGRRGARTVPAMRQAAGMVDDARQPPCEGAAAPRDV
jgi:hypothetical protein